MIMKKTRRILASLLALGLIAAMTACTDKTGQTSTSGGESQSQQGGDTTPDNTISNDKVLVIGTDASFEEKWNPFIADSAYDMQVLNQIFAPIQMVSAENELVSYAGTCKAELQEDGTVIYTITVNEGMTFSNGTPVTIDDYIYGLYVRADASYSGPMALLTMPIEGAAEYYYDAPDYSAKIAELEALAQDYATENLTFEKFMEYATATGVDGSFNAGSLTDYTEYIAESGEQYAAKLAEIDATNADQVLELYAQVEFDQYLGDYDVYNWFLDGAKKEYAQSNLEGGIHVPEITGIQKVDELTCTVKYTKASFIGDRDLTTVDGCGNIASKDYYGAITKGDVSSILSNMTPMGSGPYVWGGFADNIVTCTANSSFFKGAPVTGIVRWQNLPINAIIENLASGVLDIANPTCNQDNVKELDSLGIPYHLVDNDGYGYVGVNANRVPKEVRQGVFSLMNRAPAVEAYYGDLATVIERPSSTVVSEYPQDATTFYPYGRENAMKFFEAAGYTQQDGKLVNANGEQLVVNAYIGGEGEGNHPAYPMLVQAAEDMAALGGEIQIQDVNFNILQGAMHDGTADMWIMAWSAVNTCDKFAQFHTTGGQNRFRISDPELDKLLEDINESVDFVERKALVAQMLDLVMENAVELPIYQRKNMFAYNDKNLNMDTIPTATTFYKYEQELYLVETIS